MLRLSALPLVALEDMRILLSTAITILVTATTALHTATPRDTALRLARDTAGLAVGHRTLQMSILVSFYGCLSV